MYWSQFSPQTRITAGKAQVAPTFASLGTSTTLWHSWRKSNQLCYTTEFLICSQSEARGRGGPRWMLFFLGGCVWSQTVCGLKAAILCAGVCRWKLLEMLYSRSGWTNELTIVDTSSSTHLTRLTVELLPQWNKWNNSNGRIMWIFMHIAFKWFTLSSMVANKWLFNSSQQSVHLVWMTVCLGDC